jgi:hypothetical protein
MLDKLISVIPGKKNRDLAMTAGGMVGVLTGNRVPGLAMFAKGLWGLEQEWRKANPDFSGDFTERWKVAREFYDATHQHPTNRKLHKVGIWMVLGGTAGLLIFPRYRPLWMVSASSFVSGWALNFIGHGVFEKNAPAFADDPLSFAAAIAWDVDRMTEKPAEPVTVHGEVKFHGKQPEPEMPNAPPKKASASKTPAPEKNAAPSKKAGKKKGTKKVGKKATKKAGAKKAAKKKPTKKKATKKAAAKKTARKKARPDPEKRINVKPKEPARA